MSDSDARADSPARKLAFGAWALLHGMVYQVRDAQGARLYAAGARAVVELYPCAVCRAASADAASPVRLHLQALDLIVVAPWKGDTSRDALKYWA